MEKTTYYQLNKPEAADPLRVADFNENADKIDGLLKQVDDNSVTRSAQVRSEAANALAAYKTSNDAAVAAVSTAVGTKAEQSAVDALTTAVAAGLKLETGSYSGTGACGSTSPNTLTFSFPPKIVGVVVDETGQLRSGTLFLNGQTKSSGIGCTASSGSAFYLHMTWSGNSVSWYTEKTSSADSQLNASGYTYRYFAIG